MAAKSILIVDDNHLLRQALRLMFDSEPDFEVAREAENAEEAIGKAEELKPDLIVIDLSMPGMNGLEAVPILLNEVPNVILVLLTNYASYAMASPAREAGIHAVVSKNQAATHLMPTIRALFAGDPLSPIGRAAVA
jgi:DNA-binding NarL/FixJ family response regulator